MAGEHQHGDDQRKLNDGRVGQQAAMTGASANEASAAREEMRRQRGHRPARPRRQPDPTGQAAAISTP